MVAWGQSFGHHGYLVLVYGGMGSEFWSPWLSGAGMVAWGHSFGHHGYPVIAWWHGVRVLVTMAMW